MSGIVSAQWLIDHYDLKMLPVECTLFSGTYRSASLTADGNPIGTAMIGLYCREPLSLSLFHRLAHDEVWHFYGGDPMRLILLHTDGSSEEVILGPDPAAGQLVQHVVPAGVWQAGETVPGGDWTLFGCTMAPGFAPQYFEGGHITELSAGYPDRIDDILRLGVPDQESSAMPESLD